jgi:hypothetical protein
MQRTQLLSAAAALLFVATTAQAQRGQDDRRGHQDQRAQVSPTDQQRHSADDRRRVAEPQQRGVEQPRPDQARAEEARAAEMQSRQRAAQNDEQRRDLESRQRAHEEQIERAQRAQQEERLEQAQRRAQVNRAYDRDRDDRVGYNYRYNMGGVYRETNQYGVDALRQAVDQGYRQGYRAGQMDRRDGAPADYQRAFDFQNGEFGYSGSYVPRSDYGYYLREGFQRGYDDAYWNRARYGTFTNGNASILSDIVSGILGLTTIR